MLLNEEIDLTNDQINSENAEILEQGKKSTYYLLRLPLKGLKNASLVIIATGESASIIYSTWTILSYYPPMKIPDAFYPYVSLGPTIGFCSEVLHLNSMINDKSYHRLRLIKEAVAGATVAMKYIEQFFEPNARTIGLSSAGVVVIASIKTLVDIFGERPAFNRGLPKLFNYLVQIFYSLMVGAGICDYVFAICDGVDQPVDKNIQYGLTAIVSAGNLLAELPILKSTNKNNFSYKLARSYRSLLYGLDITLFSFILLLTVIVDIHKIEEIKLAYMVSDEAFFSSLGGAILLGLLTMLVKYNHDESEEIHDEGVEQRLIESDGHANDVDEEIDIEQNQPNFWAELLLRTYTYFTLHDEADIVFPEHRIQEVSFSRDEQESLPIVSSRVPNSYSFWSSNNHSPEASSPIEIEDIGFRNRSIRRFLPFNWLTDFLSSSSSSDGSLSEISIEEEQNLAMNN